MPATTSELLDLLDLEVLEPNLFRGAQPDTRWQRTFGGQVLAQALVAGCRTVEDRKIHSLHALFLHGGRNDAPIIYDVMRLRDGRHLSTRRVDARQHGRVIFTSELSFKTSEDGLDHSDRVPSGIPDPDECPTLGEAMTTIMGRPMPSVSEWDALDVRFAGDGSAYRHPNHATHMRLWVRTNASLPDDAVTHRAILAYLSDMSLMVASIVPHLGALPQGAVVNPASIDHAMWFHRKAFADQWMLYDQVSPSASGSLGFSVGRLMQDGRLIATCAQEGVIRVVPAGQATSPFAPGRREVGTAPGGREVGTAPGGREVGAAPGGREVGTAPGGREVGTAPDRREVGTAPAGGRSGE